MAMTEYLVRFAQAHESFRLPELKAVAAIQGIEMEVVQYSEYTPFCIIRLPDASAPLNSTSTSPLSPSSHSQAAALISRSILSQSIHELLGTSTGPSYPSLHSSVRARNPDLLPLYATAPFRFTFDSFRYSRPVASQRSIIEDFSWLDLQGPVLMKGSDVEVFTLFEEWSHSPSPTPASSNETIEVQNPGRTKKDDESLPSTSSSKAEPELKRVYLGRFVATSGRAAINTYSLKKRNYLSTTSMDAELALITANLTHAREGTMFYDPFVGTGSLTIACAHFGTYVWGSDIDGRMLRGKDGVNLRGGYGQYRLEGRDLGGLVVDLVNGGWRGWAGPKGEGGASDGRRGEWLDGIVCDPPYGVREGLRTLGGKEGDSGEVRYLADGTASHLSPSYIPPKKPYSFIAILEDLLSFAAATLVPNGRLSFWMPSANDENETLAIPMHPRLEVMSVCIQPFNKWSRRLLTYRKRSSEEGGTDVSHSGEEREVERRLNGLKVEDRDAFSGGVGKNADDLNSFRKRYFQGFKTKEEIEAQQREERQKFEGIFNNPGGTKRRERNQAINKKADEI